MFQTFALKSSVDVLRDFLNSKCGESVYTRFLEACMSDTSDVCGFFMLIVIQESDVLLRVVAP